jgi:chromosome segregation ATPase
MITNQTIFWTQITSIVLFVIALFALYRLLVEQKDSTIQLQKENIAFLKDQIAQLSLQRPDVLVETLANRVELLESELSRLRQDSNASKEEVQAKLKELSDTKSELDRAKRRLDRYRATLDHISDILSDNICQYCDAARIGDATTERNTLGNMGTTAKYACGYQIKAGIPVTPCPRVAKTGATG